MKKVLLILPGNTITVNAIDTAIKIAQKNRALINVFLNEPLITQTVADDASLKNMQLIENLCRTAGIDVSQLNENEISLSEVLINEYTADFIVSVPDHAMLLRNAKCPVYIVSSDSNKIENIILSYDGSFSSINAIKYYTQLFPEMQSLPTHFVQVSNDDNEEFVREKNIESWLPQPFNNAQYKLLKDGGMELFNFIKSIPGCLTVIGTRLNRNHEHFCY